MATIKRAIERADHHFDRIAFSLAVRLAARERSGGCGWCQVLPATGSLLVMTFAYLRSVLRISLRFDLDTRN
jgi:hypothetical protein